MSEKDGETTGIRTGEKIRVLVVEDSLTVRARLVEVLGGDASIEVVAQAADGKKGIELCLALRPDVITMDMMLPVMTGLGATEYIMAHCPTPILIVSSSINRGELFRTYEALAAGAVDVLDKPGGHEPDGIWEEKLLRMVKLVSRIKVITHLRARLRAHAVPMSSPPGMTAAPLPWASEPRELRALAIGASTGGPAAIVDLLQALPLSVKLPILMVMHIGEPFGGAFAEWLDGRTGRRVAFARDGELLGEVGGRVVMAPPNRHMIVRDGRLRLTEEPERHSCRPSVDALFDSVARELGSSVAACLLTGMGRDGASGLLAIRIAGGYTIAQDEATCVVYGMPREAVQLGAAVRVLPLGEIAPALASLASARPGAKG